MIEYLYFIPDTSLYHRAAKDVMENIGLVPVHCRESILDFIFKGHEAVGFVLSVLEGDLFAAVEKADSVNKKSILCYVEYLTGYAPAKSYGSKGNVKRWASQGGLAGLVRTEFNKEE